MEWHFGSRKLNLLINMKINPVIGRIDFQKTSISSNKMTWFNYYALIFKDKETKINIVNF